MSLIRDTFEKLQELGHVTEEWETFRPKIKMFFSVGDGGIFFYEIEPDGAWSTLLFTPAAFPRENDVRIMLSFAFSAGCHTLVIRPHRKGVGRILERLGLRSNGNGTFIIKK